MRDLVYDFARDVAECLPTLEPVVEIGARAAAGQEHAPRVRDLFPGLEYIGCDLEDGDGVDRIEDTHALTFAGGSIGTVLCLDTLEHVADPHRALAEIRRVLRPGGIVAMSSVMFFPIHQHPWDYWRFTPEAFDLLLRDFESRLSFGHGWDLMPDAVFGIGVNGPCPDLSRSMFPRTDAACRRWGSTRPISVGPLRFSHRELWSLTLRESAAGLRAAIRKRLPSTDAGS